VVYLATVPSLTLYAQVLWTKTRSKKAMVAATGSRPANEKVRDLEFLRELAEAETLRPTIDRCYRSDEIAEAHRHVESGHKIGSVVLTL